jgi:hypothetical protein
MRTEMLGAGGAVGAAAAGTGVEPLAGVGAAGAAAVVGAARGGAAAGLAQAAAPTSTSKPATMPTTRARSHPIRNVRCLAIIPSA